MKLNYGILLVSMGFGMVSASTALANGQLPAEVRQRSELYKTATSNWHMEVATDLKVYATGDGTTERYLYRTAKPGERFQVLAWNQHMTRVKFENGEVAFVRRKIIDPKRLGATDWEQRIAPLSPSAQPPLVGGTFSSTPAGSTRTAAADPDAERYEPPPMPPPALQREAPRTVAPPSEAARAPEPPELARTPETPPTKTASDVPSGKPSGSTIDVLQGLSCEAIEDKRFQCYKNNIHTLVGRYAERGRGRITLGGSKAIGKSLRYCYKYVKMSNTGTQGRDCGFFRDNQQGLARQAITTMSGNGFINLYNISQMKAVLKMNGIDNVSDRMLQEVAYHVSRKGMLSRGAGNDLRPIGSIQVYSNGSRPGHIEVKTTAATYASDYASVNPIDRKSGKYPLLGSYLKKDVFVEVFRKYSNGQLAQEANDCRQKLKENKNKNFMGSQPQVAQSKRSSRRGGRN